MGKLPLLLEIRTALYALLLAFCGVAAVTVLLAWRQAKEELPVGCGTAICGSYPLSAKALHGKELFITNCASCHNKNMKDRLTGPALGGVRNRWAAYPPEDLYDFIRDSERMIKVRHPRARQLWKAYQPMVMNSFKPLSDQDIEALLIYIDYQYRASAW